jgi:hypothetical protein
MSALSAATWGNEDLNYRIAAGQGHYFSSSMVAGKSDSAADDRDDTPADLLPRGADDRLPRLQPSGLPPNPLWGIPHNGLYVPRTVMLRTGLEGRVFPAGRVSGR